MVKALCKTLLSSPHSSSHSIHYSLHLFFHLSSHLFLSVSLLTFLLTSLPFFSSTFSPFLLCRARWVFFICIGMKEIAELRTLTKIQFRIRERNHHPRRMRWALSRTLPAARMTNPPGIFFCHSADIIVSGSSSLKSRRICD